MNFAVLNNLIVYQKKCNMKNYAIVLVLLSALLFSCGETEEERRLKGVSDSLASILQERDESVNDFVKSFNEIEENLATIKEKEKIITLQTQSSEGFDANAKDRINNDILAIYELLLKNKKSLSSLDKKFKNSNIQVAEFKKMIEKLNRQLEEKDGEINSLKDKLVALHINIDSLNVEIDKMEVAMESLSDENREKEEVIQKQDDELNKAYYAIGTVKELRDNKVVTKEGGFIGMGRNAKLSSDFNQSYFQEVDIRSATSITINHKKVGIITTHPAGSFELIGENPVKSIEIKDPKKFWSVSKYLVIVLE